MYRWKDNFSNDDLELAETLMANVRNVSEDDNSVSASILTEENCNVSVSFKNNRLDQCECSCCEDSPCYHVAVLLYYIENNCEDFKCIPFDEKLKKAVYHVDEKSIKDFLFNELMVDSELKDKFCDDFDRGKLLCRKYYIDKLENILDSGIGDLPDLYENPDINLMYNSFYDFINNDISNLIIIGEDAFAAELLNRCAFVLYDELNVTSSHWYDCAEIFDENATILFVKNEENPDKVFEELLDNTFKISRFGL